MNFAEEGDVPPVPVRTGKHKKCPHGREKARCRDCGGGSICIHNREKKKHCATCNYYTCYGCSCVYKGHRFSSKAASKQHMLLKCPVRKKTVSGVLVWKQSAQAAELNEEVSEARQSSE